jgi:hypothetical protein
MEYIFKFIVHSRVLYERAVSGKGKNEFQDDMRSLFQALVLLMENTKNETLLIQVFDCLCKTLIYQYSANETSNIRYFFIFP